MDWRDELISLYLFVCKHYKKQLSHYCERNAPFSHLSFSDEEVITLYLYGIIEGYRTLKSIHRYADRHLKAWFPCLPKYAAFDHRINQLHDVFVPLVELLCTEGSCAHTPLSCLGLIDAMPIIMAQRGRRFKADLDPLTWPHQIF